MSVLNHGYWKFFFFPLLNIMPRLQKHSRQLVPFNQFHEFAWLIYTHANVSIKLATVMTDSCQHCYTITTWYLREKNDHKGIMQYIDIITMVMFFIGPVRRKQTNLDRKVWYTVYILLATITITSYVNISISCRLSNKLLLFYFSGFKFSINILSLFFFFGSGGGIGSGLWDKRTVSYWTGFV